MKTSIKKLIVTLMLTSGVTSLAQASSFICKNKDLFAEVTLNLESNAYQIVLSNGTEYDFQKGPTTVADSSGGCFDFYKETTLLMQGALEKGQIYTSQSWGQYNTRCAGEGNTFSHLILSLDDQSAAISFSCPKPLLQNF